MAEAKRRGYGEDGIYFDRRDVPVEEIARLAGHASSRTTEVIYRRELRPVITTGAEVMDQIFQPKQRQGVAAGAAGR
jgi:hypothetical protein